MAKYAYRVLRQRPEAHPHHPDGVEDVNTEDFELAASWIARGVVQFDVGEYEDTLFVWRVVGDEKEFVISKELCEKTRKMDLRG